MSLYEMFETAEDIETQGFLLEVQDGELVISFRIARAGGRNKKFATALQAAMKPHEMAAQRGGVDEKIAEAMLTKCISKHIVLDWDNVTDRNSETVEYSPEACYNLLTDLPDLRDLIWKEANAVSNFQAEVAEETGKA